ncbi:penicillin-binding protein activator LpoA, partial [Proteus mirabilis]|nr:penicillin-binding protein activator LpoA [Proteus mirabilis]
ELGISSSNADKATTENDNSTDDNTAECAENSDATSAKETEAYAGNSHVQLEPIVQNNRQVIMYETNSQPIDLLLKQVQQEGA